MNFDEILGYGMNGNGRDRISSRGFSGLIGGGVPRQYRDLADNMENPDLVKQVMGEMHAELINQRGQNYHAEKRSIEGMDEEFLRWLKVVEDGEIYVELGKIRHWDEGGPFQVFGRGYDFSAFGMRDQFLGDWERLYKQWEDFHETLRRGEVKMGYLEKKPTVRRLPFEMPTEFDSYGMITTFNAHYFDLV
jgi:hypothetical protein